MSAPSSNRTPAAPFTRLTYADALAVFEPGSNGRAVCPLCQAPNMSIDPDGDGDALLNCFTPECQPADLYRHAREILGGEAPTLRPRPGSPRVDPRSSRRKTTPEDARALWDKAQACRSHPYLSAKSIDPERAALRVDARGFLLVPMFDAAGEIQAVQRINPDDHSDKRTWGSPRGTRHVLAGEGREILAEGYATAWAIRETTGRPVVVCFHAGNLVHVAPDYPDAEICADVDPSGAGARESLRTGRPVYLPPGTGKRDAWDAWAIDPDALAAVLDRPPRHDPEREDVQPAQDEAAAWYMDRARRQPLTPENREALGVGVQDDRGVALPLAADLADRAGKIYRQRTADALARVRFPMASRPEAIKDLAEIPDAPGVHLVRAPLGSGKTSILARRLADAARARGESVVYITHRQSLVESAARMFDMGHYRDRASEHNPRGLAICLPSIVKDRYAPALDNAGLVIVDEVDACFHFLASGVCRAGGKSAADVRDRLRDLIRNAPRVLAMSADVGDLADEAMTEAAADRNVNRYELPARRNGKTARILTGKRSHVITDVTRRAVQSAADGKPALVLCESADLAHAVERYAVVSGIAPASVLCVTDARSGEKPVRAWLNSPDTESERYNLVVASPKVTTGVSLEGGHFRTVVSMYAGRVLTPAEHLQQLARCRTAAAVEIGLESTRRAYFARDPDGMAAETPRHSDPPKGATDWDRLAWKVRRDRSLQRGDPGSLAALLIAQGYAVEVADAQADPLDVAGVKDATDAARESRRAAERNAEHLDDDTYHAWQRREDLTEAQRRRLAGNRVRRFWRLEAGEDLDGRDYLAAERGTRRAILWAAVHGTVVDDDESDALAERNHARAVARLWRECLEAAGLDPETWSTAGIGPDAAARLWAAVMERQGPLAVLGVLPARYAPRLARRVTNRDGQPAIFLPDVPQPASVSKALGEIVRRIAPPGFKWSGTRQRSGENAAQGRRNDLATSVTHGEIKPYRDKQARSVTEVKGRDGTPVVRVYALDDDGRGYLPGFLERMTAAERIRAAEREQRRIAESTSKPAAAPENDAQGRPLADDLEAGGPFAPLEADAWTDPETGMTWPELEGLDGLLDPPPVEQRE